MRTMLSILMLLAICTAACDAPPAQRPAEPEQVPVVKEYGDPQAQTDQAMEELTSRQKKIEDSLAQWRNTPAPAGPTFEGEEDALAQEILDDCDTLEREASALSQQEFVREHQGAGMDLKDMVRFAQETREEINQGK